MMVGASMKVIGTAIAAALATTIRRTTTVKIGTSITTAAANNLIGVNHYAERGFAFPNLFRFDMSAFRNVNFSATITPAIP
jgi:hypothetical protein